MSQSIEIRNNVLDEMDRLFEIFVIMNMPYLKLINKEVK